MKHQDRKGGTITMESVYKRRTKESIICLALLLFLILPYTANAGVPPVKAANSTLLTKEELLCRQIQDKIKNKQEIRKVVKASIQMGYGACGVIKCAIKGGGNPKQVIEGAVEAGTSKDVVSRCALDAGAEAKFVSVILMAQLRLCNIEESGLGYSPPEESDISIPPPSVPKRFLSPSGF
jgi:hypothetical protein